MTPRRVEVNLQDLVDAMTAMREDPTRYYLDRVDGVVVCVPNEDEADDESRADLDPDRHVVIPRNDAHADYDAMARFAATVEDDESARLLELALHGRGAFARFRDVVHSDPDLRARWQTFKEQADRSRARAWLEELGIEAVDASPPRPPQVQLVPEQETAVTLVDLLLLGAPDGKTELIDGRVRRVVEGRSASEARRWFRALAREAYALAGLPWRNRLVEGRDALDVDRLHLHIEGVFVELDVDVPRVTWDRFS
jgi:hypothetical protein